MSESEEPIKPADRDAKTGRFLPGNRANPNGRPTKRLLTDALRDMTDPDELAKLLLRRAKKSDQVLIYVFDRLEGKPKQAVEVSDPLAGEMGEVLEEWRDLMRKDPPPEA